MGRIGLGILATLIASAPSSLVPAGAAVAAVQPASTSDATFPGNWRHLAVRAGSGRALKLVLVDSAQADFSGGGAVRIVVIDERAVGGVRSNLLQFRFNCSARRATMLSAGDYDAGHQLVPLAAGVQPGMTFDAARLWYAERARQFACGELQAGAPAEGGAQAYADRYFARVRNECAMNPLGPFCSEI